MVRFWFLLAALLLCFSAAKAGEVLRESLTETRWLAADADIAAFLLETPGECLRPPSAENSLSVEIGRTAFRSPFLFGGQAARGGLSCNSCHRDGRGNPDFFLPGLSGEPGTADVTSSLFSKVREDGAFNPLPIPSLLDVGAKETFGSHAQAPSLHAFIESAVEDEFQGAGPPQAVLDGVVAYVSHLDSGYCPAGAGAKSLGRDADDIRRALTASGEALAAGDEATADFMLLAAQGAAGAVHERFSPPGLSSERAALSGFSRKLGVIRATSTNSIADVAESFAALQKRLDDLEAELGERSAESLYSRPVIEEALPEPKPETGRR